jgi:hypothetical protein
MPARFTFADAYWFRVPLKVLVLAVTVLGLVSLWPALSHGSADDHQRALLGLLVVLMFMGAGTTVAVAISDSYVEIDEYTLFVRFEAFFSFELPLVDIVAVRVIDPRPQWRYRFGLSTNYTDRIACSHGGPLVEIELARPHIVRLWPRHLAVQRVWLGVREHAAILDALSRGARSSRGPVDLRRAA